MEADDNAKLTEEAKNNPGTAASGGTDTTATAGANAGTGDGSTTAAATPAPAATDETTDET